MITKGGDGEDRSAGWVVDARYMYFERLGKPMSTKSESIETEKSIRFAQPGISSHLLRHSGSLIRHQDEK